MQTFVSIFLKIFQKTLDKEHLFVYYIAANRTNVRFMEVFDMKRRNKRQMKIRMIKILLTAIVIVTTILSFSALSNGDKKSYDKFEEVYVRPGDTLWSVAEDFYGSNIDLREAVYMIKECSEIESSSLSIGQRLLVPVLD